MAGIFERLVAVREGRLASVARVAIQAQVQAGVEELHERAQQLAQRRPALAERIRRFGRVLCDSSGTVGSIVLGHDKDNAQILATPRFGRVGLAGFDFRAYSPTGRTTGLGGERFALDGADADDLSTTLRIEDDGPHWEDQNGNTVTPDEQLLVAAEASYESAVDLLSDLNQAATNPDLNPLLAYRAVANLRGEAA